VFGKLKASLAITLEDSLLFTVNGVPPVLRSRHQQERTAYINSRLSRGRSPYLPFYSEESVEGTLLPVDTVVRAHRPTTYALAPYVELPVMSRAGPIRRGAPCFVSYTAVDSCASSRSFHRCSEYRCHAQQGYSDHLRSQAFAKPEDSVIALYRDILGSRYEYDFYDFVDSLSGLCSGGCFDWHDSCATGLSLPMAAWMRQS